MKKIIVALMLCGAQSMIFAGKGGAVAGGLFGGMMLGSMMANANQPRYVQSPPQTVVIRDEPRERREQIVQRVVCVDQDGYEIPCPKKRQRLDDRPDNYNN